MIRLALPVAVFVFLAGPALAERLHVPGLSPNDPPEPLVLPECVQVDRTDFCARVLACIGKDGLWFDGQARGWNRGTLVGQRSDGVVCAGNWAYGRFLNTAQAKLECQDGLTARMVFTAQDSLTGTGIAHGIDSRGRFVKSWTGANVLTFLGETPDQFAQLPCGDDPIPVS